jgi:hypothetical protein
MGMEENQDDYADPENEARMFHEVGDPLPGNDLMDEPEAEQKQNQQLFQVSNLALYRYTASIQFICNKTTFVWKNKNYI